MAGHSHAGVFGVLGTADLTGKLQKLPCGFHGFYGRTLDDWLILLDHSAGADVFYFWNGNQHLSAFLFQASPTFDFHLSSLPKEPVLKCDQILPEEALREFFGHGNEWLLDLLGRQKDIDGCRRFVCGTPPPKGNDQKLRVWVSREPAFVQRAERLGVSLDDAPFSPLQLRKKMWSLVQDLLKEAASKMGARFIPVPSEAFNSEGCLDKKFWMTDATHANGEYGRLWVQRIMSL